MATESSRPLQVQIPYVCITTNQPDTKYNPNPATKQHAVVSIQLNIVTRPTYPEKFTHETMLMHRFCNFPLALPYCLLEIKPNEHMIVLN